MIIHGFKSVYLLLHSTIIMITVLFLGSESGYPLYDSPDTAWIQRLRYVRSPRKEACHSFQLHCNFCRLFNFFRLFSSSSSSCSSFHSFEYVSDDTMNDINTKREDSLLHFSSSRAREPASPTLEADCEISIIIMIFKWWWQAFEREKHLLKLPCFCFVYTTEYHDKTSHDSSSWGKSMCRWEVVVIKYTLRKLKHPMRKKHR